MSVLPCIHILFENPDWNPPLVEALEAQGFDVHLVYLDGGVVDPSQEPAQGIWLNRISPSSHTRGHNTVELGREYLYWLQSYGRRVVNGLPAFELEMSKLRQDLTLRRYGIRTPKTVLASGRDSILEAAKRFDGPFITKHNQGGKGLGIELFRSVQELQTHLDSGHFDPGPGAKIILQQFIESPERYVTRVELVGGRFLLAMRSDTSDGFELCPSDACQVPGLGGQGPEVCPADAPSSKFSPSPLTAQDPLVQSYISLMQNEGIEIAGIEFIQDADGARYTYDINGTTNYSGVLAQQTGVHGMVEFAIYLRRVVAQEPTVSVSPERGVSERGVSLTAAAAG